MKRMIKQLYVAGIVFLLGLTSCNDWLDVQSKIDIKEDGMFDSESGYWDALVGVYAGMGSTSLYGTALTMGTLDIVACNYDIDYGYFMKGPINYPVIITSVPIHGPELMPSGRECII